MSRIEVVATVPPELPRDLLVSTAMRTTLGVLVELIAESRTRIALASPFLQLETVFRGPLGVALKTAAARDVLIDVVSTAASVATLHHQNLSSHRLPMSVRLWQPRSNLLDSQVMGSHAKFCVVDGVAAYLGSANFTQNGLAKHFELGALVRGRAATDLWSVITRLFEQGFFVPRGWAKLENLDE